MKGLLHILANPMFVVSMISGKPSKCSPRDRSLDVGSFLCKNNQKIILLTLLSLFFTSHSLHQYLPLQIPRNFKFLNPSFLQMNVYPLSPNS